MSGVPSGYPTITWVRLFTEGPYYFVESQTAPGTDGVTDIESVLFPVYRNGGGTDPATTTLTNLLLSAVPSPLDMTWRVLVQYGFQKESVAEPGNFYTFVLGSWLSEKFNILKDGDVVRDQWHGLSLPDEAHSEGYTDNEISGTFTEFTADQPDPYVEGPPPPPPKLTGSQPNMPPSYLPNVSNAKGIVKATGTTFSRVRH